MLSMGTDKKLSGNIKNTVWLDVLTNFGWHTMLWDILSGKLFFLWVTLMKCLLQYICSTLLMFPYLKIEHQYVLFCHILA